MRVILMTGKGGVGKTSVAAATGLRCAELGYRTLVLSTDPAHSLADSFDLELGHEPREVRPNLWGAELDALMERAQDLRVEDRLYAIDDRIATCAGRGATLDFALRLIADSADERLTRAFRLVVARPPRPEELKVLRAGFDRHRGRFRADPDAARKLVSVGESRSPSRR